MSTLLNTQYNSLNPESIGKQLLPNTIAMGLGGLSNDDFIPQKSVSACPFSQINFFYFFATLALCINICLFMSLSITGDFQQMGDFLTPLVALNFFD